MILDPDGCGLLDPADECEICRAWMPAEDLYAVDLDDVEQLACGRCLETRELAVVDGPTTEYEEC